MIVSMLASTAVFAEGEDMADNSGADCGERIAESLEIDSSAEAQDNDQAVRQE